MRKAIGVVVVLLALLVGLDRVAVSVAQGRVATTIRTSQDLTSKPDVTIHGFPFLTQLLGGTYDDVEATLTDVRRGTLRIARINVHLRGVHVPFGDVTSGSVRTVPVDRVDGTVTLAYDDLTRRTGVTARYDGSGGVTVSGTVEVVGRRYAVQGVGTAEMQGRSLHVGVGDVTVDGTPAPAAVAAAARNALAFTVVVPALPFGVDLAGVRGTPQGLAIAATGQRIVLRRGRG